MIRNPFITIKLENSMAARLNLIFDIIMIWSLDIRKRLPEEQSLTTGLKRTSSLSIPTKLASLIICCNEFRRRRQVMSRFKNNLHTMQMKIEAILRKNHLQHQQPPLLKSFSLTITAL